MLHIKDIKYKNLFINLDSIGCETIQINYKVSNIKFTTEEFFRILEKGNRSALVKEFEEIIEKLK